MQRQKQKTKIYTIKEIAKKADVSVATISRFFDSEKRAVVHPKTRKRIESICRKYHYYPDRTARAFRRRATDTIGMVTPLAPDIVQSPFYAQLISGIIQGVQPLAYDLKWITVRPKDQNTLNIRDLIQKYSIDGVIVINWRIMPEVLKDAERGVQEPAVLIDNFYSKVRTNIVYCENASGVRNLCDYLHKKGYQSFGMMRGPSLCYDATERFETFRSYLPKLGHALPEKCVYQSPLYEEGVAYEEMLKWIKKGSLPDVIFCANDDIALGVMRALDEKGFSVPDDVAIVGYDDTRHNHFLKVPLTSVRQPLEAMGIAAVEMLAQVARGENPKPLQRKFIPELKIRKSC